MPEAGRMRNYSELFRGGVRYAWPNGVQCETEISEAGVVNLPTGKVVVADPDWASNPIEESEAVASTVAPGRYPVSLLVAVWKDVSDVEPPPVNRVCASKLRISDDQVVEWRPAFPSTPASDGGEVEAFGISVDSGTASFFDFSAREWLSVLQSDDDQWRKAVDHLRRDLYVTFEDQQSSANVVIFECGMGDGVYEVWLGLSSDGQVAEILVDLEFLSHSLGIAH